MEFDNEANLNMLKQEKILKKVINGSYVRKQQSALRLDNNLYQQRSMWNINV